MASFSELLEMYESELVWYTDARILSGCRRCSLLWPGNRRKGFGYIMKRHYTDEKKHIYIAPDADVVGNVTIGEGSSVWYHAVIRAEGDTVSIGRGTNIQDNCVIHTDKDHPMVIGDRVTVGHKAILHGCCVGDETLIGMGAIVLNDAVIGSHCIIGAGALVTQHTVIEDGSMVYGSPAKVIRSITDEEQAGILKAAEKYTELAEMHFSGNVEE